jgi:cytidyltransferase-like protein
MSETPKKQVRVYVDMVGDMWHYGHVNFCRQARSLGDFLIVGICKDEDVIPYKRVPVLAGHERVESAKGCRYVDEVLYDDVPLTITEEFIKKQ